jgi:predicted amidohydrolase
LVHVRGVQEAEILSRGQDVVSVKTELGILGFGICYDLRFPELYRKMAILKGVEVFLQPSAWPLVRVENWVDLCHARAVENMCYLVSCNCAGFNRGKQFLGHSAIIDPEGFTVASAGLSGCIVKGEMDMEGLRRFRKDIGTLEGRVLSV